jgi:arginine/lysine/ornithine decarboxylase
MKKDPLSSKKFLKPGKLTKIISNYLAENYISCHTPNHSGKLMPADLTELDELDSLDQPKAVLKDLQEQLADQFKAKRALIVTAGASQALQIALLTLKLTYGNDLPVLLADNVHRSVINFCEVLDLEYEFIQTEKKLGLSLGLKLTKLKQRLQDKNFLALVCTNPTYEGLFQTIPELDLPVIQDAAHGAHLEIINFKNFSNSAADLKIYSLHKSLCGLTQSALICLKSDKYFNEETLLKAYGMLHSTSPSYLLLSNIADISESIRSGVLETTIKEKLNCILELEDTYVASLNSRTQLIKRTGNLDLKLEFDPFKLILLYSQNHKYLDGEFIYKYFKKHKIVLELTDSTYALALLSFMHTEYELTKIYQVTQKLASAIFKYEIPAEFFFKNNATRESNNKVQVENLFLNFTSKQSNPRQKTSNLQINKINEKSTAKINITKRQRDLKEMYISEALNMISAQLLAPCPPGRALVLDGELITRKKLAYLKKYIDITKIKIFVYV